MEKTITNIKTLVEKYKKNNAVILAFDGITLDTCDDDHDDNLSVYELVLTPSLGKHLYGNTNWGLIDLEETITDEDDWYTLEDVLKDEVE